MVCVSCIVIPFLLWVFNRFLRPILEKFWSPKQIDKLECPLKKKTLDSGGADDSSTTDANGTTKDELHSNKSSPLEINGLKNGHTVKAGGEDKKTL